MIRGVSFVPKNSVASTSPGTDGLAVKVVVELEVQLYVVLVGELVVVQPERTKNHQNRNCEIFKYFSLNPHLNHVIISFPVR